MAIQRTFGWVQNPNRLETLKYIVGIFEHNSSSNEDILNNRLPLLKAYGFISEEDYDKFVAELDKDDIEIEYELLKGKGVNGAQSRKDALCSGIIQASITAHSSSKIIMNEHGQPIKIRKPYVDDWTSDGYLRWAISTGLLIYDNEDDTCKISSAGKNLIATEEGTDEEKECFTKALLSYPPVYRMLDIMSDKQAYTKFELGAKLGFKGEMGFTSIPQEIYVYDYCTEPSASKKKDIKSNMEGDSDKYARTMANWLVQMGWVEKVNKRIIETYYGLTNSTEVNAWKITRAGEKAIIRSKGNSSNPKIPKIVRYEMLATKVPNADYIRLRRAHILNAIKTEKSLEEIARYLKNHDLEEPLETIKDELKNFKYIGICVSENQNKYKLSDKIIDLEIPVTVTAVAKDDITKLKDDIRSKLHNVNHDYLVLVDLAYSDAATKARKNSDAKEFEIQTAKLLTEELNFNGERLGDANRPDVIIYYDKYGTIIDNKSYKDGFSLDAHCKDEMSRYIEENKQRIDGVPSNEWWKNFGEDVTDYTFLFVTSFLKGNFKNSLEYISQMKDIDGGAIAVDNLLYVAEALKSEKISYSDFFTLFNNDEIVMAM